MIVSGDQSLDKTYAGTVNDQPLCKLFHMLLTVHVVCCSNHYKHEDDSKQSNTLTYLLRIH